MQRLKNHAEFVGVLRRHQRVTSADIVVHYALVPEALGDGSVLRFAGRGSQEGQRTPDRPSNHKIGLAVPNSVGHAVVRNKIKRRFRVLGRKYETRLPEGCKVVLRAKPSAARAEFSSLDKQMGRLFSRIAWRAAHPKPASSPRSHR